mmetsp:Transcript_24377/g.67768  ORF Transcript_24377/g.67768 Transcript_24377/m.67768 type:complete len:247 (-) Transcript_24377:635-1375(-)
MDSSTADRPCVTMPSTGIRSPGRTRRTSPTLTAELGTSVSSGGLSFLPKSITSRALAGMRAARDLRSPEASVLACASRVRPSSTTASSITGSSRKALLEGNSGTREVAMPPRKEVVAPRLMREFMLGAPAHSMRNPSMRRLRPGPRSARAPRAPMTGGLPMAVMTGPCARPCRPAPCSMWPTWWVQHTNTRPHARASSILACAALSPCSSSDPQMSIGCPGTRIEVAKPLADTASAAFWAISVAAA